MIRQLSRSAVAALLLGSALAVPFSTSAFACADPRGNAYCTNNGLVDMTNPNPGGPVGQNPNPGGLVNTQNPMPGQVTFASPPSSPKPTTPGQTQTVQNIPAAPAQPQTVQNSQAVVSSSRATATASITVDPPTAAAGDTVAVTVSGLQANASFVVNLGQLKTPTGQIYGAKSMPTADGAALQADGQGNFSGTFTVPAVPDFIDPQGSVCAVILGSASYCTPLSLQSVGLGADGQPGVDPAAGAVDGTGTTFCYSCGVLANDDARRYGVYNSGSGNREYNGAHP